MEDIYDQVEGKSDVPHRHDYFTTLLVEEAEGEHEIDFQIYSFGKQQVFFVAPGQVHQVVTTQRPIGWVITFSRAFLAENNIPESFISNINLFRPFGHAEPLVLDVRSYQRVRGIMEEIAVCLQKPLHYRTRALGALLQLFLIYCNNSRDLDSSQLDEDHSGICMLRDFKQLVDAHYHEWHKVSTYAAEIFISSKHLSQTIKQLTGHTAKELIQERIGLEAKRLLLHTDLSIKKIAYELGFEEPLHFSGFFKKYAGSSPKAFRKQKL